MTAAFAAASAIAAGLEHWHWCEARRIEGINAKFFLPDSTRILGLFVLLVAVFVVLGLSGYLESFASSHGFGFVVVIFQLLLALAGFCLVLLSWPWAFWQSRRAKRERERVEAARRLL